MDVTEHLITYPSNSMPPIIPVSRILVVSLCLFFFVITRMDGIQCNDEQFVNPLLCYDYHEECSNWSESGRCEVDSVYMNRKCPYSCEQCHKIIQTKISRTNTFSYKTRYYDFSDTPERIVDAMGADLGVPQKIKSQYLHNETYMDEVRDIITKTRHYVNNVIMVQDRYKFVRNKCRNYDDQCAHRAVLDNGCEYYLYDNNDDDDEDDDDEEENDNDTTNRKVNPHYEFMLQNCAPVCRLCNELHVASKCPLPHPNHAKNAWYPGDLDRMFQRIVQDPIISNQYDVTVLSRPIQSDADDSDTDHGADGPWIITIDNFFTAPEANRLIELGTDMGYERSTDAGNILEDGKLETIVSFDRTSTNAWCTSEICLDDPIANMIYERIAQITNIPSTHYEPFQLLRYEMGQYYKEHHDYIDEEYDRVQGVRLVTVFLYLNTIHESDGGGTNFPLLDITVQPIQGRALIWSSVLNHLPNTIDPRTQHQALPILGPNEIKYAANVWIHQRELVEDCI